MKIEKKTILAAAILASTMMTTSVTAASFNCHKASTPIEKAICSDRYLNALDGDMGKLYHKAKVYQKDLPSLQKEWIHNRNRTCGANTDCLYKWTENRITNFQNIIKDAKAGIPVNPPAKKHSHNGSVYSPEHGIICDKKSGFCADREGISLGFTQEYLGEKAANKFSRLIEKDNMDTSSYTLSNGIYCDANTQKCYNNKWKEKVDRHWTGILFR